MMRKRVLLVPAAIALAGVAVVGYRSLSRDYRYFQLVRLGDDLLAEDLPFQAARAFSSAIAIQPGEPVAYIKLAAAEERQGNLTAAVQNLERAAELPSDAPLVALRLGELYAELGRFDDAASRYELALRFGPESSEVLYALGLVHFRGGKEAEALDALTRAAALDGSFWEAFYLRGAVFRALGADDEAEADYRRALALRPDAAVIRSELIDFHLDRGDTVPAMELVRTEIDANPGAAGPYLKLAAVHRSAGRRSAAIDAVGLAIEQDPNLPAAYLVLGELWLEETTGTGDPIALDKAVAALESAQKMDPDNGAACLALGRAYLATRDEARATALLERATRATPAPAEAHRLLGDLYSARKDYKGAVTAYHVFLKLNGEDPAVLERLGDTYLALRDTRLAAETYLELSALERSRAAPLVKAARAFLAAGDADAAAGVCRRGLAIHPENGALLSLLAESRRLAGPPRS